MACRCPSSSAADDTGKGSRSSSGDISAISAFGRWEIHRDKLVGARVFMTLPPCWRAVAEYVGGGPGGRRFAVCPAVPIVWIVSISRSASRRSLSQRSGCNKQKKRPCRALPIVLRPPVMRSGSRRVCAQGRQPEAVARLEPRPKNEKAPKRLSVRRSWWHRRHAVADQSSLTMVATPWLSAIVAPPVGLLRLTKNVSFASTTVSPRIGRLAVREVWPGAKLSVRLPPV